DREGGDGRAARGGDAGAAVTSAGMIGEAVSRRAPLLRAHAEGEGLSIGIRLRVALDLLEALADGGIVVSPRSAGSMLRVANVAIDEEGCARVEGEGDATGAGELLWEVLAAREAEGELEPIEDAPDVVNAIVACALGDRS